VKLDNYYPREPSTYSRLKKELDISKKKFFKTLIRKNIDSHSQVRLANLYANRLKVFIGKFLKKGNINFLDCGCGFGYIARELIKTTNLKIYYCDPSKSIKKIHDKIFPKENFFCSDIQNLFRFKRKYDLIYLREIYPFTRDANFKNQKKLIQMLNKQLRINGLIIFEQIKNKEDLFDNLSKFNFKYKIIPLLPVKLGKKKFLNLFFFKSLILQLLLKIIYTILFKKISYYIIVYKF
jgi:SAM-dependent methyltransferase